MWDKPSQRTHTEAILPKVVAVLALKGEGLRLRPILPQIDIDRHDAARIALHQLTTGQGVQASGARACGTDTCVDKLLLATSSHGEDYAGQRQGKRSWRRVGWGQLGLFKSIQANASQCLEDSLWASWAKRLSPLRVGSKKEGC
jgi:hypothetical protein